MGGAKIRYTFAKWITEKAKEDNKIILLVGDIGYGLFDDYPPMQFFNLGLCEQSMISVASGMALEGLKPYVYTITPFLIERPFEQIKIDIDQQNVNVKLIGYADYPDQGITHAEIDAPYLMRMFRNIDSYFPIDSDGTRIALNWSYSVERPTFISMKKAP